MSAFGGKEAVNARDSRECDFLFVLFRCQMQQGESVMISTRTLVRVVVAFSCCVLLVGMFPGCAITGPDGSTWKVHSAVSPQPNQGTVVGTFVGQDGDTYELVDTNGDGVPDFAVNQRTGEWRPISPLGPPTHVKPAEKSQSQSGSQRGTGPIGGEQSAEPFGTGWNERINWDSGIDPPMPIEFTGTAAESLEMYGLNVEPGALIESSALELHLFDTDTHYADATFKWSNAFLVPNVLDYPQLNYELYMLHGEMPDEPWFLSMRIAGPASSVLRFGLEMSADNYFEFEFDASGSHWKLAADGVSMTAAIYENGNLHDQFPIN